MSFRTFTRVKRILALKLKAVLAKGGRGLNKGLLILDLTLVGVAFSALKGLVIVIGIAFLFIIKQP